MEKDLQVAYTVRLNGLGKGSIEYIPAEKESEYEKYWTPERLKCTVCGELNLDEYLCFNCKGSRECTNCCGCYELEEGEGE